jgi:hypothetical protein
MTFYSRIIILLNFLGQAYTIILRGLVFDHYYTNLKNKPMTVPFDQVYNTTCNYFEGPEYKHNILK